MRSFLLLSSLVYQTFILTFSSVPHSFMHVLLLTGQYSAAKVIAGLMLSCKIFPSITILLHLISTIKKYIIFILFKKVYYISTVYNNSNKWILSFLTKNSRMQINGKCQKSEFEIIGDKKSMVKTTR